MKTVLTGALALVLLASTAQAALAQDDGGERRRESRGDGSYNPAMRASSRNVPPSLQERQPAPQAQAPQSPPQAQAAQSPPQAQVQPQGQGPSQGRQGGRRGDSNWQSRQGQQGQQPPQSGGQRWNNGEGRPSWQGQQTPRSDRDNDRRDDRHQGWNNGSHNNNGWNDNRRDWRPDRNQQQRPRFDRRYYGQNFRSQQRYRGYAYRPPSGFYIRSWGYGDVLPRSWWSTQYRLNDWWAYGLPIPPIGYEYVRVGDDVLLVDMFSGRVVQMIYDVFW